MGFVGGRQVGVQGEKLNCKCGYCLGSHKNEAIVIKPILIKILHFYDISHTFLKI